MEGRTQPIIPSTLDELHDAEQRGNPVVIAGYGRESTHKGYLSWILSSDRNKAAIDLIRALIKDIGDVHSVRCEYEKKVGNHKIDLLLQIKNSGGVDKMLPIELKTDSGPSGENQFKDMSEYISNSGDFLNKRAFCFCLGSSSIQDFDSKQFERKTPEKLIKAWGFLYGDGPEYFKHWMDALGLEVARMKLAHEAYKRMIENKVEPGRYGYRSYKHLMYYVYALFRKYVETIGHSPKWLIYEGGYNAVMNLDRGSDSWVKAKELPRVEWYFEFNDDIFHLKLHQQSEDSEAVSKWVDRCVKEMTNIDNARGMGTQFKRSSSWKKGWPSIAHWNTNFMDFEILHREINSIINSFGSNGVLGQL